MILQYMKTTMHVCVTDVVVVVVVVVWLMDVVHAHYVYVDDDGARRPWASSSMPHTHTHTHARACALCALCGIDDDACDERRAEDDEDEDEDKVFIVDFIGMDCTDIDCFIFSARARTSTTTGCDARCASRCA